MAMIRYDRRVQGFVTGFADGMSLHPVLRGSRAPQVHEPGVKMIKTAQKHPSESYDIRYFTKGKHDARQWTGEYRGSRRNNP